MREEYGRAESYARRSGRYDQPVSDNAHIIPSIGFNGNTRAGGGCVTPSPTRTAMGKRVNTHGPSFDASSGLDPIENRLAPQRRWHPVASGDMAKRKKRLAMFIETETTPYPARLKFLPGCPVMEKGTADFADANDARR